MRQGIDTSHWSGQIIWRMVKDSGLVEFVFNKATEGTTIIDSQFLNNKNGCNEVGIPNGAYHFFRPLDAIAQADFFVNTCGDNIDVYVCDVETTVLRAAQYVLSNAPDTAEGYQYHLGGGRDEYTTTEHQAIQKALEDFFTLELARQPEGAVQVDTLAGMVKTFMERIYSRTGKMGIIYTSPGFWNTYVAPNWIWPMPYDLWVAHWGVIKPTIPQKWTDWVFWQYTTSLDIPGIPSKEDGNWVKDNVNLVEYFGNGDILPPPAERWVMVNTPKLNIRNSVKYWDDAAVIGHTYQGKKWLITGEERDNLNRIWLLSGPYVHLASWYTIPTTPP